MVDMQTNPQGAHTAEPCLMSLAELAKGQMFGGYELLAPVGEGGMASVWLARRIGTHGFEKQVALKLMLPQIAAQTSFRQMFLDEARIASRIQHANVASTLDLGEQGDVLYLVLEWIEGESLSSLHKAASKAGHLLPTGIVLRILSDVCAGLHAAHELKDEHGMPAEVVHRDISPQNIMVTLDGTSKVIDFGVAKARGRLAKETSRGVLKGKVSYMSPEQALGGVIDRRSDVFAVGATLYKMLSGRAHYTGTTSQMLRALIEKRSPDPLPERVHPALRAVVEKALAVNVEDRYASARALRTALEEAMEAMGSVTSSAAVEKYLAAGPAAAILERRESVAAKVRGDLAAMAAPIRPREPSSSDVGALDPESVDMKLSPLSQHIKAALPPELSPSKRGHYREWTPADRVDIPFLAIRPGDEIPEGKTTVEKAITMVTQSKQRTRALAIAAAVFVTIVASGTVAAFAANDAPEGASSGSSAADVSAQGPTGSR